MKRNKKDVYLTTAEAGKLLGFCQDHVRRLVLEGKIKATKLGHNWLIMKKDLKKIKRQRFPRKEK